ncbi:M4 family metallopeptidase [Aliikangiella sp. IMCC44359]|uniref:M4 family metallopeptidase n=1 Tax=Aliikangiella sp. IMCC44359 TaxID=3459125 RepID=UPI00403B1134
MKLKTLSVLVAASLSAMTFGVSANDSLSMTVHNQTSNGTPSFVTGNLGSMTQKTAADTLKSIISSQTSYGFTGKEDFQIQRQWIDELGKSHTHFNQTINGLKVYGTSMILHANVTNNALTSANTAGEVYALTGTLAVDSSPANSASMLASHDNGSQAKAIAQTIGNVIGSPELSYIYVPETGATTLAWRMEVSWDNGPGDFGRDFMYYDASSNELITRHPQVHSAKSWKTYTLNGGNSQSAPGRLLCTNNQSCGGNQAAQRAHDGASKVHDYFMQKHNRDSLDGNGMTMISSVDLGEENAYWTGSQMLYGRAGQNVDNDFTSDFDVIAHEFTHGVTGNTAKLVYRNESGALNEAWSDIFGVTAESFKNGTTSSSWLLGDGLYNQAGKAFRYMNNPTKDNRSKDYYPERYTGTQDNGGVHMNSGIANLAYVLLVDGGSHPRNKTNATVPQIGMAKAEKIFYRALTTYMNQNTQFSGARTATASAAQDLYGATEKHAVETAWCAVGVGSCPTGPDPDPDPDPTPGNELQNGVAKTGLSANAGSELNYTFKVPTGASNINFVMSGGSGDADLYVKFGSKPTDSSYDCRPYKSGNAESCTGSQTGGTYYVRLKAYSTFSNVSIKASYTGGTDPDPDPTNPPIDETVNNVSVAQGQWTRYTQVLPAGYSTMTVTISGGTGDADLYVRKGAQSTQSAYDCRPYKNGNSESCSFNNPGADTWYIDIYGYSAASGITLNLKANP